MTAPPTPYDWLYDHEAGNSDCPCCWGDYPVPCPMCKEGLLHAEFGEENYDSYSLLYWCDHCGTGEAD